MISRSFIAAAFAVYVLLPASPAAFGQVTSGAVSDGSKPVSEDSGPVSTGSRSVRSGSGPVHRPGSTVHESNAGPLSGAAVRGSSTGPMRSGTFSDITAGSVRSNRTLRRQPLPPSPPLPPPPPEIDYLAPGELPVAEGPAYDVAPDEAVGETLQEENLPAEEEMGWETVDDIEPLIDELRDVEPLPQEETAD